MAAAAAPKKDYDKAVADAAKMKAEGVAFFKEGEYGKAQQKFAYAMMSTLAILPKGAGKSGGAAAAAPGGAADAAPADGDAMGGLPAGLGGMLDGMGEQVPERLHAEVIELHCGLLNNMASILMNKGKHDRAISRLSEVLALQPDNIKALAKRAKAYWKMPNGLVKCEADVTAVLKLDPTHKEALKLQKQVNTKNAAYAEKEKKMFAGMFS
mmetsp:Transcript_28230/g.74054  ORF Transcript_28230/g.74054 Transcript_28230/m.74054 type:complete len:211 (+) Transcript_28230:57-689(+)|eukprot:CAMPEP_0182926868 /NCGR_PEP_ID=MMETSP0105_2-20130417/12461_1 /TAXON_ID=81532 ORGANISM="Acanthoeca-like sp., Strain 10tr" /NCGR_SAMPLE_ID=MMETSP0105_2 /ASSEMBLY_ACC=CAM_ASM_000205 /LENGTH=210 /DNA_ID=CAMNT_0025064783 /DNA_START=56 /DNA_END=688 /DNA_ORIENTATION=+